MAAAAKQKKEHPQLQARHVAADRKAADAAFKRLSAVSGYPETFSIFPGETLFIRAARKPSRNPFTRWRRAFVTYVDIRDALTGETAWKHTPANRAELIAEKPRSYRDGGAGYSCRIAIGTQDWVPGVYECVVHDTWNRRSSDIYVNVKPREIGTHNLVCVLPSFTWQAYNRLAGGSFYSNSLGPTRTISTQRPINRAGDNTIHASLPFLAAFAGDNVDFVCVDSADLHHGRLPQGRAPVMALLAHDEYWSEAMRAAIDLHLAKGGALLVLAGNVCWWKIAVDGDNLVIDKTLTLLHSDRWFQAGRPEERTFVSSYRFGGIAIERARRKSDRARRLEDATPQEMTDTTGIKISNPDHPIFRGVALEPGDRFGSDVPILYREIDAVPLTEDGAVDRLWYDADDIQPKILATGTVLLGKLFKQAIRRVGVVVEAEVGGGYVVHMGSIGWSLGMAQKNEAVKQIVLNAYRYCRSLSGSSSRKMRKRRKDAPA